MIRLRNSSKTRPRCLASSPLPHRGIRNCSYDAPITWGRRSRDLLGACLADSSFPDGAKKRLIQLVSLQFPCRALLHQWGKEDSPNCPFCNERESLGHIQSRCKILEKPRIAAHHMIWREILLQLFGLSCYEGDEHKWVIPSAVSAFSAVSATFSALNVSRRVTSGWGGIVGRRRGAGFISTLPNC